jgi:SnoaL-like domain
MNRTGTLTALMAGAAALVPGTAMVQSGGKLSTQDYVEIEQLTAGYPYKIDNCTNSGYDYADQYTDDAVFGVSSAWGGTPKIWYRGREELANAGGGGKGGCRPRRTNTGRPEVHHVVTSQVITPSASGASGKSTLMAVTGATKDTPPKIEWQGGYEDTYVKTAKGWRFKSRYHTWPGHDWPDTAAEQAKLFAAPPADSKDSK